METQDQEKEKQIQEMTDKIKEVLNMGEIEELIKKNEVEFDIDGTLYRVKKPSFKQRQEVYNKRITKFIELLKDDKNMLEKDLKELYKKRGIDVDAIVKKINTLLIERNAIMMKLGEAIKEKKDEKDWDIYKIEILKYNEDIQNLTIEKTRLLEYTIENQLVIFSYSYMTYLITEKKDGENWIRVWNTMDEFESAQENIINKCSYYTTLIAGSDEIQ